MHLVIDLPVLYSSVVVHGAHSHADWWGGKEEGIIRKRREKRRPTAPVDNRTIVPAVQKLVTKRKQKRCIIRREAHLKVILHMTSRDFESLIMIQGVKNCRAAVTMLAAAANADSPCRDQRTA